MALALNGHGVPVRDMYPANIARVAGDPAAAALTAHEKIPATLSGLERWFYVSEKARRGDKTRPYVVLYVPREGQEQKRQVTVKLYGMVSRMSLNITGNWDGSLSKAPGAVQFIELEGGPFRAEWAAQVGACDMMVRALLSMMQATRQDFVNSVRKADHLYIRHRVFEKARTGIKGTAIPKHEDPGNRIKAIQDSWVLGERVKFGHRTERDTAQRCSSIMFTPGDFVSVVVTFELVVHRSAVGINKSVFLNMNSMCRLRSSADVMAILTPLPTPVPEPEPEEDLEDEFFTSGIDFEEEQDQGIAIVTPTAGANQAAIAAMETA